MTYLPPKPSELNDSDMKIPACDFLKYQQKYYLVNSRSSYHALHMWTDTDTFTPHEKYLSNSLYYSNTSW